MPTFKEEQTSKEEILLELGLSQNDAKVYAALVRSGTDSITEIAKKCGIHRANVYGAIERLKIKGLVSELIKNNKKIFQAAEPSSLFNLLKEKELRLKSVMPQFMLDHHLAKNENQVEIYQGANALRNLFRHYLEIGKDIYAFGIPKTAISIVGETFQNAIHKKRAEQKQWMYHIYNSDAKERMKFLNTLPFTEAKYLGKEYDCPVLTLICGGEASIVFFSQNTLTLVIRNKEMAEAYQKYFGILWEKAKKD